MDDRSGLASSVADPFDVTCPDTCPQSCYLSYSTSPSINVLKRSLPEWNEDHFFSLTFSQCVPAVSGRSSTSSHRLSPFPLVNTITLFPELTGAQLSRATLSSSKRLPVSGPRKFRLMTDAMTQNPSATSVGRYNILNVPTVQQVPV